MLFSNSQVFRAVSASMVLSLCEAADKEGMNFLQQLAAPPVIWLTPYAHTL